MVLGHRDHGFWLQAFKCCKVGKQSSVMLTLRLLMLPCFREDGATKEQTASMEDLQFKVHTNTSEGADHFILFLFRKTPLSYTLTKTPTSFSQKDACLDEHYFRKLGGLWG